MKSWGMVALVSVPMAISLAIVCGATPLLGLLSWARAWVLAAIFCSSRHNAYWPAGALAWVLFPISVQYGIQYFPILAILAWVVMILVWLLRLSRYLSLIPGAVLQWFLLWIALIIWLQQLPAILWLDLDLTARQAIKQIGQANLTTIWLFGTTLLILQWCRHRAPQVPGIVVVTLVWVIAWRFFVAANGLDIDLLVDRYWKISFSLFQWIDVTLFQTLIASPEILQTMITASISIAVIALLETLISAKIASKVTRTSFWSQREVYGLGVTNIFTWLVWGIPVSALVPRTTYNIDSWATNKRSWAFIWIGTALLAAFAFTWWLQYLPFAVIAWVLVDIALGMFNVSLYHKLWNTEKSSIGIIWVVWVVSYLIDPMVGILLGTSIALLMVVMRAMKRDLMTNVFRDGHHIMKCTLGQYLDQQHPDDILLIKLEGELNYLTTEYHTHLLSNIDTVSTLILWVWSTCVIDNDAAEELDHLILTWLWLWIEVYITWLEYPNKSLMVTWEWYTRLLDIWHVYESKTELLEVLLQRS